MEPQSVRQSDRRPRGQRGKVDPLAPAAPRIRSYEVANKSRIRHRKGTSCLSVYLLNHTQHIPCLVFLRLNLLKVPSRPETCIGSRYEYCTLQESKISNRLQMLQQGNPPEFSCLQTSTWISCPTDSTQTVLPLSLLEIHKVPSATPPSPQHVIFSSALKVILDA